MTFGVVIVTWNGAKHIVACLRSVFEQTLPPAHMIVVDNASEDDTPALVAQSECVARARGIRFTVIREAHNTGFTRGANTGMERFLSADNALDAVVLLNQDAELDPGWTTAVAEVFESDSRVGAVGARLLTPDRQSLQHAGGYLERPRLAGMHLGHHVAESTERCADQQDVEFVTAAAMAVRVAALRDTGYFNEIFSPGYYEDVDLCELLRVSGWRVVYAPAAVATHVEGASFSSRPDRLALSHRNRMIYALPSLVDSDRRTTFYAAERLAFTVDSPLEERRALSLAYLQIILMMPEAMKARLPSEAVTVRLAFEFVEMFGTLREEVLASLRLGRDERVGVRSDGAAEPD